MRLRSSGPSCESGYGYGRGRFAASFARRGYPVGKVRRISGAPRSTSAARLVVVLLVLVCCAVWAAAAVATTSHKSAGVAPASQVVLGSSFQPIRAGVLGVWASGDYLLSTAPADFTGQGGAPILINDRLGTTTALDPRCEPDGLGPPWVLMACQPGLPPSGPYDPELDLELYSVADGTRQTVTPSPGLPTGQCSAPNPECPIASPDAVGADWIRWDASCYHCADTAFFQNIETGELRDDPTNATTFADLNSPALAHQTCPGVSLMRQLEDYWTRWGPLASCGQFAIAIGTDSSVNETAFLERCGTHMRRRLVSVPSVGSALPASNSSAIVWPTSGGLNGLFLPSPQSFTLALPSAIVDVEALGLTSGALYVRDWESGTLWRTASPTALPLNTIRPRLTRSGSTLTCRRGTWRNAGRFGYAWRVNGTAKKSASKPRLAVGKARRRGVSCSVTASNAAGTTTASSAQIHVR
jgi:hypothetical protein